MSKMTPARRRRIMADHGIDPLKLYLGAVGDGRPDPLENGEEPIPLPAMQFLGSGSSGPGVAVLSPIRGLGLMSDDTTMVRQSATRQPDTKHKPSGLKPPAPKPPGKVGYHPLTGELLEPVELPPAPEPLPPPAPFRLDDPIDSWLSDADLNQQLRSIATEATYLDGRLAELGEPNDDEDHAVFDQRQRYTVRLARLTERHRLLRDERSRRFDKHVDQVARDRAAGRR